MKFAVCVPSGPVDCYGHLNHYANEIARIGAQRSIGVEILRYTDSSFLSRLLANLADPECVVHFHCYLYDLRVIGNYAPKVIRLTESCAAKTLATISDHPFQNFMQDMVRKADAATRFIVIDDTFADEMRLINSSLGDAKCTHMAHAAPVNYNPCLKPPLVDRNIDLVLPMLIHDIGDLNPADKFSAIRDDWLKRIAFAAYEVALSDTSRSTFHIFSEQFEIELNGATLKSLRDTYPKSMPSLLNVMDAVDGLVRHTRRHNMVRALLRTVGKLNVIVMGTPVSSLAADSGVKFVGGLPTSQATELMARSKAILNCNPTYPHHVPERVTVGMLYGSCVITDVNPRIADTFMSNEFIPYSPQSTETIWDICNNYDVAAIGQSAADKVAKLAAFSWDAHFDGLLSAVVD